MARPVIPNEAAAIAAAAVLRVCLLVSNVITISRAAFCKLCFRKANLPGKPGETLGSLGKNYNIELTMLSFCRINVSDWRVSCRY
jgi:hypothetical protein